MENDVNSAFILKYNIQLSQSILAGEGHITRQATEEEQAGICAIVPLEKNQLQLSMRNKKFTIVELAGSVQGR